MTRVELYVDPSCPFAWVTSRWLLEVAPQRDLSLSWRSYCLEIRDEFEVPETVPAQLRQQVAEVRALSHRLLRIFEAARAQSGDAAVDRLYAEWGRKFIVPEPMPNAAWLEEIVGASDLPASLLDAADDRRWDAVIAESMDVAYGFGGAKTQTPIMVVDGDPPRGFKGPVMMPAPTGATAVELWDALTVLAAYEGFFEVSRPRTLPPVSPS